MAIKSVIISLIILAIMIPSIYLGKEQSYKINKQEIISKELSGHKRCNHVLEIKEINLQECLYNLNSSKNNLSYGLKVLKTNPLIIAGHSGTGHLAIFNNLDKLKIGSEIMVDKTTYMVDNIYQKEKDAKLKVRNDLILITCYQDKQLVLEAKKA